MTATTKASQVMAALFARAALLETSGPNLRVSFPEAKPPFTPPANGKYLRVTIFPNVPKWQGCTDGIMDQGLLQVSVVWPKEQGIIEPTNVVGQVKQHFAKGTTLISGSTKVKIGSEPWHSSNMVEDISSVIHVTIPWTA